MIAKCVLFSLSLLLGVSPSSVRESPLQCWRCEATVQSTEESGVFLDDCQAEFDFTQHTLENCDGKCWKSVDLMDFSGGDNYTGDRFRARNRTTSILKSSRRCFSADELLRAAELGINTSDSCRKVKQNDKKFKEVCFCSDLDMCNRGRQFMTNIFILFPSIFLSIDQ